MVLVEAHLQRVLIQFFQLLHLLVVVKVASKVLGLAEMVGLAAVLEVTVQHPVVLGTLRLQVRPRGITAGLQTQQALAVAAAVHRKPDMPITQPHLMQSVVEMALRRQFLAVPLLMLAEAAEGRIQVFRVAREALAAEVQGQHLRVLRALLELLELLTQAVAEVEVRGIPVQAAQAAPA